MPNFIIPDCCREPETETSSRSLVTTASPALPHLDYPSDTCTFLVQVHWWNIVVASILYFGVVNMSIALSALL